MELGQRLRQARQEAGMSQRQLCGERITRNMLSQIENGSARPSMETLRYIAGRLGKPVSYFLGEEQLSANEALLRAAEEAAPARALELLADYTPDDRLDPLRYWLEVRVCMALAEQAIETGRLRYAAELLEQARQAGEQTAYYTEDTERRRLLLCYRAKAGAVRVLAAGLPSLDEELLLRAEAALEAEEFARAGTLLEAAQERTGEWHLLMGRALLGQGDFAGAAACLEQGEAWDKQQTYALLERCYTALEDYKMAYTYACKQRELEKGNTFFFGPQDV